MENRRDDTAIPECEDGAGLHPRDDLYTTAPGPGPEVA